MLNGAAALTGFDGKVWVTEFSGLTPGGAIFEVQLHANAVNATNSHVQIVVYNDTASAPSNLLGSVTATLTSGFDYFVIPNILMPRSGNVWVGFLDEGNGDTYFGTNPGTIYCTHVATYPSAPSTFGVCTPSTNSPRIRMSYEVSHTLVKFDVYNDTAAAPSQLLSESSTQLVPASSLQNFSLGTTTVPSSGNLWLGFQTNNSRFDLVDDHVTNGCTSTQIFTSPTPSTFGACTVAVTTPYALVKSSNSSSLTFKFDSTTRATSPATVLANGTGGFSGVTFTVPTATFGSHTINASDAFRFATAPFTVTLTAASFNLTGYVIGPNGFFDYPKITLTSTSPANVTQLWLFDSNGFLQNKTFSTPIHLFSNYTTTVPWNFTDARGHTGSVTYYEQAVIQQGALFGLLQSNNVTLNYGSFTVGKLNINQTNTNTVSIWFQRTDVNSTATRISVIFPNAANLTCNLAYQFAATNHNYFNMPKVTYDSSQKNSSFLFKNSTNDIITITCRDLNSANSGKYILTQTVFPFIQQIQNFRAGTYGTTGQFGMLDIVTLSVVIFSMIGFNRINESVGAFFSVAIVGIAAYWGILSFPGVIAAAVAIVVVLAVISTRKTGGF